MTDHLFELPPTFSLYHHKAIFPATFFGGPLVAGYLAAENFKLLDKPEKATSAWLISIAVTVMIFGTIVLIPALEKLPRFVIPAAYSFGAQALILKYQGHALNSHSQKGGKFFSAGRIVIVTVIGLAISFAIVFGLILLLRPEMLKQ
jgi:hypothetical protein